MAPARREALILGVAGVAAAAAGFLVGPLLTRGSGDDKALETAAFRDLQGRRRPFSEWRGRVLVVNFWATWCAPCREEIPLLMDMAEKYQASGIQVLGIAIDNVAKVGDYARNMRISYPILLAEADGLELMRQLGNSAGGLPYTVIVARQGGIAHRKLGAYQRAELEAILAPLAGGKVG